MKKEFFICDSCGTRTRLDRKERHWCDVCDRGAPVEMRHVRDKRLLVFSAIATLISPIPVAPPFAAAGDRLAFHRGLCETGTRLHKRGL
jgi:hypothetical protein